MNTHTFSHIQVDVPAGQLLHAVAPASEAYCPDPHASHVEHPVVLQNVPAGHGVQTCAAASCTEYVPGSHAVQVVLDVAPCVMENVPTWQAVQLPVPHVYKPCRQNVLLVLVQGRISEYPGSQTEHV